MNFGLRIGWGILPHLMFIREVPHASRQPGVRPADGLSASSDVSADGQSVWWPLQGQVLFVLGPIPGSCIRPTHIPGESSRHRSDPASACLEALPHGTSGRYRPQHTGQRQRPARLANLRRLRSTSDGNGPPALRQGFLWCRPEGDGLRLGFHDHRPVPFSLSVGSVPEHEGRHQAAHAARSAGQYSIVPAYHGRHCSRRKRPGFADSGGWSLLCYGSGVCGLRSTEQSGRGRSLLRDTCQTEPELQVRGSYKHPRQDHGSKRLAGLPLEVSLPPRLLEIPSTRPVLGPGNEAVPRIPDQQFRPSGPHNLPALPATVAGGIVLQVDTPMVHRHCTSESRLSTAQARTP